jgi:AcrR family transcriptional regulator
MPYVQPDTQQYLVVVLSSYMARRLKDVVSRRLTREQRKARTRRDLLAAAARVFGRHGYHAATVDDIAREAGFTKGAFYSNFESKEEVFVELLADRSRNWTIAVANAYGGEGPLPERLQRGGQALTRIVNDEADWMRLSVEMWSQSLRDPRLRRRVAEAHEESRQIIARLAAAVAEESGATLPIPSDQVGTLAIALTDGFLIQRLADPKRLPAHVLADGLNAFLSGLLLASGAQSNKEPPTLTTPQTLASHLPRGSRGPAGPPHKGGGTS